MQGLESRAAAWAADAARRGLAMIAGLFLLAIAWLAGWAALAWWLKTFWAGHWVWLLVAGVHLLLGCAVILLAWRRIPARASAAPPKTAGGEEELLTQVLAEAVGRRPETVLPAILALTPLAEAARRHPKAGLVTAAAVGVALGLARGRR